MSLTISTKELQNMVRKASSCVSNNKLIPLTGLMNVKVKDNVFTLTTTDATNYFYAKGAEKVNCEDFEISVIADLFTRLIQKSTSEHTVLIVEGNTLKIDTNGTYVMELPLDENGAPIKFPNKLPDFMSEPKTIQWSTVKKVVNVNKASLSDTMDFPVLTCYYCADRVITSDRKKICRSEIKMFDNPMVISAKLMDLLYTLDEENIEVSKAENENVYVFSTSHDTIYAPETEGIETFPVDAIETLVNQSFKSSCTVSLDAVTAMLDRLSLFIAPYDKHAVYLTFNQDGILFSSKKSSGQELIPYVTSDNFEPYTCCIDIEMLKSQVETHDGEETLELYYGSEVAIKLANENVTQIIALLEDDRTEA